MGITRANEVGLGGEDEGEEVEQEKVEEQGRLSCCLVREEEELFFSVSVAGDGGLGEPDSASPASWSQPESSKTMSMEEEVQSLRRRSKSGPSPPLSCSDNRPPMLKPAGPPVVPQEGSEASKVPPADDSKLDTGTLTDSASILSRTLSGQSVALKDVNKESQRRKNQLTRSRFRRSTR